MIKEKIRRVLLRKRKMKLGNMIKVIDFNTNTNLACLM